MLTRDHIFSKVISRVWKGTNDVIAFVAKQSVGPKEEQMKTKVLTFLCLLTEGPSVKGIQLVPKFESKPSWARMNPTEPCESKNDIHS